MTRGLMPPFRLPEYGRAPEIGCWNVSSPTLLCGKGSDGGFVMQYQLGVLAICAVTFAYPILRRRRRLSTLKDVPGPANLSWIFGVSPSPPVDRRR